MSFLYVCFGVRNFKEKKLEIFSKHDLRLRTSTLLACVSYYTFFYTFIWLSVLSFIEIVFHLEGETRPTGNGKRKEKN